MPRLTPKYNEKREAALRANLLKRKEQTRARVDEPAEKSLITEKQPAKDKA